MKRPRINWSLAALLAGVALVILESCEPSVNSPPDAPPSLPTAQVPSCQASCSVFDDGRPFRLAHQLRDSSGATIHLATFSVRGNPGDRVRLALDLHGSVLTSSEREIPIIVEVSGNKQHISLGDLKTPRTAYEFESPGSVTIRYGIPRGMAEFDLDSLSLSQLVSGASIVSATGMWGAQTPVIEAAGSPTCTVNTKNFSACGVTGTITPFVANLAAQGVGGIWTSDSTTYASHTITVTFSKPVKNVTLTIADPDYSGNDIVALGSFVGFAFDGVPYTPTWDTKTHPGSGVTTATLLAAPGDYVAYRDLTFTLVDTSTVKDSIIITPVVGTRLQGQMVSFAAKTVKGAAFTVTSWYWAGPIPGGTKSPNCGTSKSCAFQVYEGGKIVVMGNIPGVGDSQASATITVTPCVFPPSETDTRIKDPIWRKDLFALVDKRIGAEGGGIGYYNPLTHTDTVIEYQNALTGVDTCGSFMPDTIMNLPYIRYGLLRDVVDVHTHAWKKNARIPTGACGARPNTFAREGPSAYYDSTGTLVGGDYLYEEQRGHIGYIADVGGKIWRFNSPAEPDRKHPSEYRALKDANGRSTCVVKH